VSGVGTKNATAEARHVKTKAVRRKLKMINGIANVKSKNAALANMKLPI
jgi:hypothetical protein